MTLPRVRRERILGERRAARIGGGLALLAVMGGSAVPQPPRILASADHAPGADSTRLIAALARYRALAAAGGWEHMPRRRLALGDTGAAVVVLRRRLVAEIGGVAAGGSGFDPSLDDAVRAFQASRGLEVDGIVGNRTRAALDVSAGQRVLQLERNLERMRHRLPRSPGLRVEVRIPAFELYVFDGDRERLRMHVIAGRPDWPTPVFDASITAVILSPYWNVPPRILRREVIPEARRDPTYLARNHMRVLSASGVQVPPGSIDWNSVRAATFPYRVRQDPGPDNALGGIKFLLPNRYGVYLHDTPSRALFARADRALSHGCIRLEQPVELALLLLADQPGWTRTAILDAIGQWREHEVKLTRPVPVSVEYQTAWVDADGTVQFREDIYERDGRGTATVTDGAGCFDPSSTLVGDHRRPNSTSTLVVTKAITRRAMNFGAIPHASGTMK
jgi:murein L,D-transpeptidase YcbB/YkuD